MPPTPSATLAADAPAPAKKTPPKGASPRRVFLLVPCGIAMLMGLDAALVLLNLPAPLSGLRFSAAHGMLMVIGFVGALVSLERSTSIHRWWAYLAPLGMALGSLLVLTPLPMRAGQAVMIVGCALMIVNYVALWRRNRDPLVAIQIGGGATALGAVIAWFGGVAIPDLIAALITFLVLTVIAERADLSRIGQLALSPQARQRREDARLFLAMGMVAASPLSTIWPSVVLPIFGVLLIALSAYSFNTDVARFGIKQPGNGRFTAGMILVGYGWLIVAGLLLLRPQLSGLHYDATLHALFLGFVMSMVMAHATTILPALLGIRIPFVAGFWGVGGLLQVSLVVRVIADLLGSENGRTIGGLGNIAALLGLVSVAIWSATSKPDASKSGDPSGQVTGNKPDVSTAPADHEVQEQA